MKLFQLYPKALAHLTCKSPDTKERKGLGTSPFGPTGLSTVPIPCVSSVFLKSNAVRRLGPIGQLGRRLRRFIQRTLRRALAARSVLRFPFSVLRGGASRPYSHSQVER